MRTHPGAVIPQERWRPTSPVLATETPGKPDPSSSEGVLAFCAQGPHSCFSWQNCASRGLGTGPDWRRCVGAAPLARLQLWDQTVRFHFTVFRQGPNPRAAQTPGLPPEGKAAKPVTPAKAMPREKRGLTEEPRKAEGVRCLPCNGRQMWLRKRESGRRGAGGGARGRGRERRAPRSERTGPPRGPPTRRERGGAGERGGEGACSLAAGSSAETQHRPLEGASSFLLRPSPPFPLPPFSKSPGRSPAREPRGPEGRRKKLH